jgi:hypothetical protein
MQRSAVDAVQERHAQRQIFAARHTNCSPNAHKSTFEAAQPQGPLASSEAASQTQCNQHSVTLSTGMQAMKLPHLAPGYVLRAS